MFWLLESAGWCTCLLHHRLAPEFPYPADRADAIDFLDYLLHNAFLKVDHENLSVAGYSAGGTLAVWLTQEAGGKHESLKCFF